MKKNDEMLMNKTEMRMLRWIQDVNLRAQKKWRDQESGNSSADSNTPDAVKATTLVLTG